MILSSLLWNTTASIKIFHPKQKLRYLPIRSYYRKPGSRLGKFSHNTSRFIEVTLSRIIYKTGL
jgi:hypothetical protein